MNWGMIFTILGICGATNGLFRLVAKIEKLERSR